MEDVLSDRPPSWLARLREAAFAPGALPADLRERALLVGALLALTWVGYFVVGLSVTPERAASLRTPLDDAIPLQPGWMWVYAGVYTASLYPLFTIRCQRLFRRMILGYVAVNVVCIAIWIAFPVGSTGLRADPASLDPTRFAEWGLRTNYALDPPINCFPSLHLAIVLMAALSALRADRRWGGAGLVFAAGVAYAICAVKQHYVLDGLGGAALAAVLYLLLIHGYDPGEAAPEEVAYTWRGPLLYLALHAAAVGAFALAFAADLRVWEHLGGQR